MKFILTICLFLCLQNLFAQYNITGRILSSADRQGLSFANVFLANTTKGTQTDLNGNFAIANLKGGSYDFIVSYIGYETLTLRVQVDTLKAKLTVLLQPKQNELKAVEIKRMRNGFEQYFTLFKDNFIGKTNFSNACKLKNPKVVWFVEDKEQAILNVNADDVLIVENKALGYIIKYQLEGFTYDFRQNYVSLLGYPFFEEMKGSERQQQKWEENRKKAYLGSTSHFLKSLKEQRTSEEGYTIQKLVRKKRKESTFIPDSVAQRLTETGFSNNVQYLIRQPYKDTQLLENKGIETYLTFNDFIYIVYDREDEEPQLMEKPTRQKYQVSIAHLLEGKTLLGENGYLPDPLALVVEGRWGLEKLGELLPLDYLPK